MKNGNFALFISLQGCPNRCIYCDQNMISGQDKMSPQIAGDILHKEMPQWKSNNIKGQIAFFGGTFTGLPFEEMMAYLDQAYPYVKDQTVSGIRISTRPDMICPDVLDVLKEKGVTHIELGVQSMDDEVLRRSGRGYSAADVVKSAQLIRSHGFVLGMQMMTGLPGDTPQKSFLTAQRIISLGAGETRIYPTVVLQGTPLEKLYLNGNYSPMELEETIELCARLKMLFDHHNVTVLRLGLHSGAVEQNIVAGPYHASFGQLVKSRICLKQMSAACEGLNGGQRELFVYPQDFDISDIIGQHRCNAVYLKEKYAVLLKISKKVLTNTDNFVIL